MQFLLTSDWHIRSTTPTCRIDDYVETQFSVIRHIMQTAKNKGLRVLHAGDLFHTAKPSINIMLRTMEEIKQAQVPFIFVPGNHDLPNHNLSQYKECGLSILEFCSPLVTKLDEIRMLEVEGLDIPVRIVGIAWGE